MFNVKNMSENMATMEEKNQVTCNSKVQSTHCGCCDDNCGETKGQKKLYFRLSASMLMLLGGLVVSWEFSDMFVGKWTRFCWYFVAYLLVAVPVMREAWETIKQRDIFNEFTLMLLASVGAFAIGEYPEGVAVMLFYSIGEMLQERAVRKAKENIGQLLDVRPSQANICRPDGSVEEVSPREVAVGDIIMVSPGGRVPLDGVMETDSAWFDTSSLTGESLPRKISKGGTVLAGMIVTNSSVRLRVSAVFEESTFARVLALVEEASKRKAASELFIRRMARVYTPAVFLLALLTVLVPWCYSMFDVSWVFDLRHWTYNALMFLVISCPCALVISVPLSYFTAIGAASRVGVLLKGGNVLDAAAKINTVVFDKTGTLTEGRFTVRSIYPVEGITEDELLGDMLMLEQASSHPIAKAITEYAKGERGIICSSKVTVEAVPGCGLRAVSAGRVFLVGNYRLLKENNVANIPQESDKPESTTVFLACDGIYKGSVCLSDALKPAAAPLVTRLKRMNIRKIQILSGDNHEIVRTFAAKAGIEDAFGDLLPEDKVKHIEGLKSDVANHVAFVGDGMNDAPALALSDVGIAMGGLGCDAAIESADIVIQTDNLSRVATAIKMGKHTRKVVWQNVIASLGVKLCVLLLGFAGVANLWEAVFADIGVALLAVLNTMQLRMRNDER